MMKAIIRAGVRDPHHGSIEFGFVPIHNLFRISKMHWLEVHITLHLKTAEQLNDSPDLTPRCIYLR